LNYDNSDITFKCHDRDRRPTLTHPHIPSPTLTHPTSPSINKQTEWGYLPEIRPEVEVSFPVLQIYNKTEWGYLPEIRPEVKGSCPVLQIYNKTEWGYLPEIRPEVEGSCPVLQIYNKTEWGYLPEIRPEVHYAVGCILFAVGTAGVLGNALVLFVFTRFRRLRGPFSSFIVNLAVADLCTSLLHSMAVISSFRGRWAFGPLEFCTSENMFHNRQLISNEEKLVDT
ncbi:hypothetical protein J6590_102653, partial [Homalodisca vitripennis]